MFKKLAIVVAVAIGTIAQTVGAQAFPSKPIKIVVPFPPGAFNDTLGRTLASEFSKGDRKSVV